MKKIIKTEVKFRVGQKVYYKKSAASEKAYTTIIKRIDINTTCNNKKETTSVHYIGNKRVGWGRISTYNFSANQLYATRKEAEKITPEQKKAKLKRQIKTTKQSIARIKTTISTAQKKLNEIKKVDMVSKLSGI